MQVGGTVTLYVSDGMKEVQVPDIKGKQRDVAVKMISDLNLMPDIKVDSATPDLPSADQYVIRFSPEAGTSVKPGTTISIVFGSHSEAFPTTTAAPTTTTRPPTTQPPTTTTTQPPTTTTQPPTITTTQPPTTTTGESSTTPTMTEDEEEPFRFVVGHCPPETASRRRMTVADV